MHKIVLLSVLFMSLNGCASMSLQNSTRPIDVMYHISDVYADANKLYVHYYSSRPNVLSFDKIGGKDQLSFWKCAHEINLMTSSKYSPFLDMKDYAFFEYYGNENNSSCYEYDETTDFSHFTIENVKKLDVNEIDSIHLDDTVFNDKSKSFYVFQINSNPNEVKFKNGLKYVFLIDRINNKILLIDWRVLNYSNYKPIKHQSVSSKTMMAIGFIPALAFDIVTLPIQATIFAIWVKTGGKM